MDIRAFLIRNKNLNPQKIAIVFKDRTINFSTLYEQALAVSEGLRKLGIKKSDKIAIYLPNGLAYIYAYLGIFSLGALAVPLDFMLSQEELENLISHSEAKILIAQTKKDIDFKNLKRKCSCCKEIILNTQTKEFIHWDEVFSNTVGAFEAKIMESDPAIIFYTSGTTGHPKGVLLTYKHLSNPVKTIEYFLKVGSQDILLCSVPLSHIGGFDYLLFMLYFSSTFVLMERFIPLEFLKNIQKFKVTLFWIVPSMYVAILSLKEYKVFDLSSLRYVVVFGAPSSAFLLKRFHQLCPQAKLLNGWGMTETSAPNCVLPVNSEKIESVGKFSPWMEAKIVDEQGSTLPQGEAGELWVRGWPVMRGYYKEPHLTYQAFAEGGWLKTGDIAKFDKEGLLYIVGRKKDMIKVGAEIVFAPEVEEVLQRHPQIKEVAVIGVKDKLRGEVPKAFVVLKENTLTLSKEEIIYFCKEHLAHFKIPHYIEFKEALPKTRTGKIDKEKLKNEFSG